MGKSLGDFNIKQSSSVNIRNIEWYLKNSIFSGQLKKRKTGKKNPNSSSTNIIYVQNSEKVEQKIEKIFKIEKIEDSEKSKNENPGKMFQKSSVKNCLIEQGYKRKAR
jgi:hypothetical protein